MAKKIPVKQLTAWSFSRYDCYQTCPLQAKLKFIDKVPEPKNDAMARGARIHDLAEQYIKGTLARLPTELKMFKAEFQRLRKQYKKSINGMVVEDTWAFTKDWEETSWNDWIGCWVRIKLDCAHHHNEETLVVTDWKTGKFRPEQNQKYIEQLELYALGALLLHEHIEAVLPRLAYTDLGVIYPETEQEIEELTFTRKDIPRLKAAWTRRVKPMMNDKRFAPRPNYLCRWCWYGQTKKAEGGPGLCKY